MVMMNRRQQCCTSDYLRWLPLMLVVAVVVHVATSQRCPATQTQVPRKFDFHTSPSEYQLIESALQIYSHIRIECDGWLKWWEFMAANQLVAGLHLGVFRPRQTGVYELIGRSHFVLMPTAHNNTWIRHEVKQNIAVKKGDCLGIFYDRFRTPAKLLSIRSKIVPQSYVTRNFPTYVMAVDDSVLSLNRTIDVRTAMRDFRSPALVAVVSNVPSNRLSSKVGKRHWSITAPKELVPAVELALYQKSLAIQAAGQSLDPPPAAPLTPVDIRSKCERPSEVPALFVKLPAERYHFAETSLQIFSSMVVECDGYLTSWHFLAANPIVEGIHLAVFRQRSAQKPYLMTLVGETHVANLLKPPSSHSDDEHGFWVNYALETPIPVKAGDTLGLFYDDYQTPSEMAAILSQGDEDIHVEGKKPSPTFVLLTDAQNLSANDTVDTRTAAVSYRLPALSATIEPLGFIRFKRS